jgi:hypothetical protein
MITRFLYLITLLLFFACNETPNNAKVLDDKIMHIHDEAMAKSALVLSLKKEINYKIDSTNDGQLKDSLLTISSHLYKADKSMLEWMHAYKTPNLNADSAEKYLTNQLAEINKVYHLTFESIKEAKAILKK